MEFEFARASVVSGNIGEIIEPREIEQTGNERCKFNINLS